MMLLAHDLSRVTALVLTFPFRLVTVLGWMSRRRLQLMSGRVRAATQVLS